MKTFQDFSPYNGLQWEPNSSRSKWEFHCSKLVKWKPLCFFSLNFTGKRKQKQNKQLNGEI